MHNFSKCMHVYLWIIGVVSVDGVNTFSEKESACTCVFIYACKLCIQRYCCECRPDTNVPTDIQISLCGCVNMLVKNECEFPCMSMHAFIYLLVCLCVHESHMHIHFMLGYFECDSWVSWYLSETMSIYVSNVCKFVHLTEIFNTNKDIRFIMTYWRWCFHYELPKPEVTVPNRKRTCWYLKSLTLQSVRFDKELP